MKSNARYLAVVHPGVVSGVALMTAAEIENFPATANDDLPEPESAVAPSGDPSSPWDCATGCLSRAFRRWVPPLRRRRAAA
jgi:hypothetical protein